MSYSLVSRLPGSGRLLRFVQLPFVLAWPLYQVSFFLRLLVLLGLLTGFLCVIEFVHLGYVVLVDMGFDTSTFVGFFEVSLLPPLSLVACLRVGL